MCNILELVIFVHDQSSNCDILARLLIHASSYVCFISNEEPHLLHVYTFNVVGHYLKK